MKPTCVFLAIVLTSSTLFAQDVVPIKEGQEAAFTGLLVSEQRLVELLRAEQEKDTLRRKLEIERRFAENIEAMYKVKLDQVLEKPAWYETPTANRWFGFALGVVATGCAVWGGIEATKAAR